MVLGGQWYFLKSSANLNPILYVGRGTAVLLTSATANEEPVRTSRFLTRQELVTTDNVTQGTIQFSTDRETVANATIFENSQITVRTASKPRFHFSDPNYLIVLENIQGRIELEIPPGLARDLTIKLRSPSGEVTLTEPGLFRVIAQDQLLTLVTLDGVGRLKPINGSVTSIPSDHTATVMPDLATIDVRSAQEDILLNSRFIGGTESGIPDGWGCSVEAQEGTPRGTYTLGVFEGRQALRLSREAAGPSEVGCIQYLGTSDGVTERTGLDVTGYSSVRIRVTLKIASQSITLCGTEASECPLMLRIDYENEFGGAQEWIHGFFAFEYANQSVNRMICDSCFLEHDRITPNAWYTYESPNMLEFPTGFIPSRIKEVRFYSSGHAYTVYVAEVSLIAEY